MSDSERFYFRNGFVLADEERRIVVREGWSRTIVGGLQVVTHPETLIRVGSRHGFNIALIGNAFDPERGVYSEAAIIAGLLEDVRSKPVFYATMDRLAGRFAIVVNSNEGTEVYQDAIGSRSVFYSTEGPAIAASHAELVREIIGSTFTDWFVPFITSKGYQQRDVKYLPGVASPYEGVLQLTPNTKLVMPEQRTERFWPREAVGSGTKNDQAAGVLISHLEGLAAYMKHHDFRPVVGLTAGTDSRGVFAALKDLDPYLYTYVRSEKANAVSSKDANAAKQLAEEYRLHANIWPIHNKLTLNAADNSFSHAFRLATGYYRGLGAPWLTKLAEVDSEIPNGLFVRGFGGEVMRGFYKVMSGVTVRELSRTYDVNAGSNITQDRFKDMMERTQFTSDRLYGYDPTDIFYWEHRMGTWGSVSMAEADLGMPSLVGYNSRNLFTAFMRLSGPDRTSRVAFEMATQALAPKLHQTLQP